MAEKKYNFFESYHRALSRVPDDCYSRVDPKGTALIKLAKGRNIGTGSFICGYDANTTHFYDLATIPVIKKISTKQEDEENQNRPF